MLNSNNRLNLLTQLDESIDVPDAFPEHARRMLDALEAMNQSIKTTEALLKEAENDFLETLSIYDRYICLLEQGKNLDHD